MGFSCFVCRGPFEQDTRGRGSEQGGGDGQAIERSVSAVAKCGHLFHTDCLKKILETQSVNAWVPKACPVCNQIITIHDIIRIHASKEDSRNNQRPQMEEVVLANRKLRDECERLLKLYKHALHELDESKADYKSIMRSKEEVLLRLEHMGRLHVVAQADIDRYKAEIEKLKNIIITLTGKLTGNESLMQEYYVNGVGSSMTLNGGPMANSMNGGNSFRLEYSEEFQRVPIGDEAQNLMNGSLSNGTPRHHPPGFACQRPNAAESGADCHNIEPATSALPNRQDIRKAFETNGVVVPVTVSGNGNYSLAENHEQVRHMTYALQDVRLRDLDTNNNRDFGKIGPPEKTNLKNSGDNAAKENVPIPPLAESLSKIAKAAAAAFVRKTEPEKTGSTLPFSNTEQNKVHNEKESTHVDDDENYDVTYDKWQEKKSRRRASSKGSGVGVRGGSGKQDFLAEKKLLYGSFSCQTCDAKWGSSQSVLNKPQTCRYCKTEVQPYSQGPILSRKQLEINKQSSSNAASDRKK